MSESGIRTAADVEALQGVGVEAVLVGESLLRQADVGVAVEQLMQGKIGTWIRLYISIIYS